MIKDTDVVPEEDPLIIFYIKSDVCMSNNGNDTNHTRHISGRVHLMSNGEKIKMYNIEWCEGCLQLADIVNNNVGGGGYLNLIMKYIMVRIDQLIENTCTIGVKGYIIDCGTRFLYD